MFALLPVLTSLGKEGLLGRCFFQGAAAEQSLVFVAPAAVAVVGMVVVPSSHCRPSAPASVPPGTILASGLGRSKICLRLQQAFWSMTRSKCSLANLPTTGLKSICRAQPHAQSMVRAIFHQCLSVSPSHLLSFAQPGNHCSIPPECFNTVHLTSCPSFTP